MHSNPVLDSLGSHPIAAIQQGVRDARRAGREVIDFSIGDPVEPTWEPIREAMRDNVPVVSQYPTSRGLPELREAIAAYVGRRFGVEVDPANQILPTSGAKEAIFSSPLAFVDRSRGDLVGVPDPGYPIYARGARLAGAETVTVEADERFLVTADSVPAGAWDSLVMLWVCTPSNPTGTVTPLEELERLVAECRTAGTILCSDECYVDLYADDEPPAPSVLQAAGPGSAGVLSYLSLSKRSGMTGYRSGAIVGDPEAIEALYRLRTSTGTASSEPIQWAAVTAWSDDAHVADRRAIFGEKRRILTAGLTEMGYRVVGSRAGIYLWVEVADDVAVTESLASVGVVVTPGRVFGHRGEGFIRLALVPDIDACHRALEVMRPALASG